MQMADKPHITARDVGRKPGVPVQQPLDMPGESSSWSEIQADQREDSQTGSLLVPNGAGWVEHDTLGVAEEVAQRWPNLRVAECTKRCTDCAALGHFPFVVCELTRSGKTVPVIGFLKLNREVIDTLWSVSQAAGDQQKLANEHNARLKAEIDQKSADQQAEALEIIGAALKSHKYDWKGPGGFSISPNMTPAEARRAMNPN